MMAAADEPKLPVFFYRTRGGGEPVRAWLRELPEAERRAIGIDLNRVQKQWPVGMPLCRPLGAGLWELRVTLPGNRIARLMFFVEDGEIYVVHGFVKKTQKTPAADIALARRRMKDTRT
jgi:phage-related protein